MPTNFDLIILGAGASGLSCALKAGELGHKTLVLDHAYLPAQKLCIAGGGFGNVTNKEVSHLNYLGQNQHFCKSILSRFGATFMADFIKNFGFELAEREHGQLFLTRHSAELRDAMLSKAKEHGVTIYMEQNIRTVSKIGDSDFFVNVGTKTFSAPKLLLALGSPAWPQCGATSFGAELLKKFGHKVFPFSPALAPLIMPQNWNLHGLQGISLPVAISVPVAISSLVKGEKTQPSKEYYSDLLFTHKGISGPATLQVSSHWKQGDKLKINFLPRQNISKLIQAIRNDKGSQKIVNLLAGLLPQRLCTSLISAEIFNTKLAELSKKALAELDNCLHNHQVIPSSNAGMKKAEAALGGADTEEFSSKTLESKIVAGLYVSGELLDITGELGGYNLHWAFASGLSVAEAL